MRKSLKKLAMITVSAFTLAAVAPTFPAFAQDGDDATVEESLMEDEETFEMETTEEADSLEMEEAEPSELQVALEDIIAAFEADYPEVGITQVKVEPLEDMEDDMEGDLSPSADIPSVDELEEETTETEDGLVGSAGDLGGEDLEVDLEEDSDEMDMLDEETSEEDPLAMDEETEEAFEITIEGEDTETNEIVSISYDSTTGEELPEMEDDLGLGDEVNVSEAETDLVEDTVDGLEEDTDLFDGSEEETEVDTLEDTDDSMMEEPSYLEFDQYADFDEVKETAEMEVPFGEAREYVLSINETNDQAEWEVTIHEDIEFPEEGRQAVVTLDAMTLEVLSVTGDIEIEETVVEEEVVPVTEEEYEEELPVEEETEETSELPEESTDEGDEEETTTDPDGDNGNEDENNSDENDENPDAENEDTDTEQ